MPRERPLTALGHLVARRVRYLRRLREMSQEQLAEAIGVSAESMSRYETGRGAMPVEVIERVAKALQVKPAALFEDEQDSDDDEVTRRWRMMDREGREMVLGILRYWTGAK